LRPVIFHPLFAGIDICFAVFLQNWGRGRKRQAGEGPGAQTDGQRAGARTAGSGPGERGVGGGSGEGRKTGHAEVCRETQRHLRKAAKRGLVRRPDDTDKKDGTPDNRAKGHARTISGKIFQKDKQHFRQAEIYLIYNGSEWAYKIHIRFRQIDILYRTRGGAYAKGWS